MCTTKDIRSQSSNVSKDCSSLQPSQRTGTYGFLDCSDEEAGREEQSSPIFDFRWCVSLVVHGYKGCCFTCFLTDVGSYLKLASFFSITKWNNCKERSLRLVQAKGKCEYVLKHYIHCKNWLVALMEEWLSWLQTSWRDSGIKGWC